MGGGSKVEEEEEKRIYTEILTFSFVLLSWVRTGGKEMPQGELAKTHPEKNVAVSISIRQLLNTLEGKA